MHRLALKSPQDRNKIHTTETEPNRRSSYLNILYELAARRIVQPRDHQIAQDIYVSQPTYQKETNNVQHIALESRLLKPQIQMLTEIGEE